MDVHPDTVLQSIEPEHAPRPAAARRTFKVCLSLPSVELVLTQPGAYHRCWPAHQQRICRVVQHGEST